MCQGYSELFNHNHKTIIIIILNYLVSAKWYAVGTQHIFSHKIYTIKYALGVEGSTPVFLKEAWEE